MATTHDAPSTESPEPLPDTPEQHALLATNCPHGRPRITRNDGFGTLRILARDGYALVHASSFRTALFVCEGVTVAELRGPFHGHRPEFQPDPELPENERAELADYRGSGFDRGHLAPLGDQTASVVARAETAFLSNVVPQDREMNGRTWNALEQDVRAYLVDRDGGYVVTGPVFAERPVETIGEHHVGVPTHLYKIVVASRADGSLEVFAFVFENRAYPGGEPSSEHLVSVDELEARTGLDFFPDLEDDVEIEIERRVPRAWREDAGTVVDESDN